MNSIIAIDPGTFESAVVFWNPAEPKLDFRKMANVDVLQWMSGPWQSHDLYIECVASYGLSVGQEVFDTCIWTGRFMQAFQGPRNLVFRRHIKLHHCGSVRAKDGNIRTALVNKYGKPGIKKKPGLTYGLSADLWQAFALATYVSERMASGLPVETHALNGMTNA